jgi:hypothetical protein
MNLRGLVDRSVRVLGNNGVRLRDALYARPTGALAKESIPFKGIHASLDSLPRFGATILTADVDLEYCSNGFHVDVIRFGERTTTRYRIATPPVARLLGRTERTCPARTRPPFLRKPLEVFPDDSGVPHTAHLTADGAYLCASSKYCIYVVDTRRDELHVVPSDHGERVMQYCSTLGFSSDHRFVYFGRWPFEDYMRFRAGATDSVRHEIGRIRLDDRRVEMLYELDFPPEGHQIAPTQDGRHVIMTPFNQKYSQYVTRTGLSAAEEIGIYKANALGKFSKLAIIDLVKGSHSEVALPAPIAAHFEFEPGDPSVVYAATHNFFLHPRFGPFLGGTSSISRIRVENGRGTVLAHFSHDNFFRLTQHRVFRYRGRLYLAYTATAYSFYIIDVATNEIWRRVRVYPDPPLKMTDGYVLQALQFPLNLELADDGVHILVSTRDSFLVYDLDSDRLLDVILTLPAGRSAYCHTRRMGE